MKKYLTLHTQAEDKQDGICAQMIRRIVVWSYCQIYDHIYVHKPFVKTSHFPDDEIFGAKVEKFFNLGHGEVSYDDMEDKSDIDYLRLGKRPRIPRNFKRNGDLFDKVKTKFREKFLITEKPKLAYDPNYINIAVHVRRGDLLMRDKVFRARACSDEFYIDSMEYLNSELKKNEYEKPIKFYLFSETPYFVDDPLWLTTPQSASLVELYSSIDVFSKFKKLDLNLELVLDSCPLSDIFHIFSADHIITSRSTFSKLPAMLSNADVITVCGCPWHKSYWTLREDHTPISGLEDYFGLDQLPR